MQVTRRGLLEGVGEGDLVGEYKSSGTCISNFVFDF